VSEFKPPYPGWAPYCLKCSTMRRMKATSYGWKCEPCGNPIGKDLCHWSPTPPSAQNSGELGEGK
jgi:hypothetical protein